MRESYTNYDINTLKSILENEFSDFSSNDADITITYTNQKTNYVIDYYYLHNGFITESGYSIVVNNGSITHIRDNTIHSQSNTPTTYARSNMPDITSEVISSAQAQAKEHVNSIGNGYCIVEQHATKYYSITENKYYYRIMSIYVTLDGAYGATFTLYELWCLIERRDFI